MNLSYRELSNESLETSYEEQFQHLLTHQTIRSVYQPIISLMDGSVFGYEALTRGPENSVFHSPVQLFEYAEKQGALYQLEKQAREKAIQGSILQHPKQMLFINISSPVICDPQFIPGKTLEVLQQYGLTPSNVVFEITERSSLDDFSLAKKILEHYRSQGYKIAIDDAGAGYSSLQAIAELHPDYIKVDRSLVKNIHKDKIKECIMETFVTFAQKMNIKVIAEGIEHVDELSKLTRMGVHYAQGFLLGKPQVEAMTLSDALVQNILTYKTSGASSGIPWMIGDLAVPIKQFVQTTLISEVANYFNNSTNESALGAVVLDDDTPVGLIMRDRLFQQLAGQYGFSLFWNRPIRHVMDKEPLIADEFLSVEQVSQMAMSRDKSKLYDLVIITSDGKMAGVTSIQSILECITNARMETAKVANPLTGLPGNIQIHRELNRKVMENKPFSVIYADLDFFKWFNDRFGFKKGDQLIQYTADIIQQSVSICGHPHDFVGHIGGDDFIAISVTEDSRQLCQEIIRRFDQGVGLFYDGEELHFVEDRHGNRIENDGVTLSLSLLICECNHPVTFEEISHAAAGLKKKAKAHRGSIFECSHLESAICGNVASCDEPSERK